METKFCIIYHTDSAKSKTDSIPLISTLVSNPNNLSLPLANILG